MQHLIIFTRVPRPGKCKTRFMPEWPGWVCADLQTALLQDYLLGVQELLAQEDDKERWKAYLYFTPGLEEAELRHRVKIPRSIDLLAQGPGSLGERMNRAMQAVIKPAGPDDLVFITGSDIPDISPALLSQIVEKLRTAPALPPNQEVPQIVFRKPYIMGPSPDGGYYLLGCQAQDYFPSALNPPAIEWSSDTVLARTTAFLSSLGFPTLLGPTLIDLDTVEDLDRWLRSRGCTYASLLAGDPLPTYRFRDHPVLAYFLSTLKERLEAGMLY